MTEARTAAQTKWQDIAAAVHEHLKTQLDHDWPDWDRLWDAQIESYFDLRTTAFRLSEADHAALLSPEAVKRFAPITRLGWSGNSPAGSWQNSIEISAMLMDASAQIRHIPAYTPAGAVPQKCTLLGTYEQMEPARLSESTSFFKVGLAFKKEDQDRPTDRLCAISLVKRFAFQHYFKVHLGIQQEDYHFPDGGRTFPVAKLA